jgi:AcrR family transcriptional regulator
MSDLIPHSPKQRILYAATTQFAAKGYAGVSVKEIADQAGVNVAMISYYFGGKQALLQAIMELFFDLLCSVVHDSVDKKDSFENNVQRLSQDLITFFRSNPELCKICLFGINDLIPELAELKTQKIREMFQLTTDLILAHCDKRLKDILAPAFVGLIFSHLTLDSATLRALEIDCNDAYFNQYIRTIPSIFINGVKGVLEEPAVAVYS